MGMRSQVQHIESVNAPVEASCWGTFRAAAATGEVIEWDVINFNEGLHSLWPRTNVTDASGALFAADLYNWTKVLSLPGPSGRAPTLRCDHPLCLSCAFAARPFGLLPLVLTVTPQ